MPNPFAPKGNPYLAKENPYLAKENPYLVSKENPYVTREMIEAAHCRLIGKYRGLVTDNNDPTGRGRLEVLVPAVMGQVPVWALPCVPFAGKNMGLYAIPEKGAGVWVEFEAGDGSHPIWVGCFWGDGQAPKNNQGKQPTPPLKILRSAKGLIVSLDDSDQVITLSDKNGKNLVSIEVRQGKTTVKATAKVVIEAPQIELVENGRHPVVFGDKLLEYLNKIVAAYMTHTHTTPTLTPSTPLPPATPDLLSSRVRTG